MSNSGKRKFRGFVMTGGGAKGFYEAGVIHAFHITGMEFDIITGSSIGAMNSVFFAEYLYKKRSLPADVLVDPELAVEAMDRYIRQYHHTWLLLPAAKIIDDSDDSPLGKLKNDLLKFNLRLPQLVRLAWWWTDPDRKKLPASNVVVSGIHLIKEVGERLGSVARIFQLYKDHGNEFLKKALQFYLDKVGIARSLVPDTDDLKLKKLFTDPVTPLKEEHLSGSAVEDPPEGESGLIDGQRTMKDYMRAGIDLRLTRANFRTGRLEISNYLSVDDFYRWFERQIWRLKIKDPNDIPLGSFRIQMPGNPNALNAALASGRYPGVFCPYPLTSIYPVEDDENIVLYDLLKDWNKGNIILPALNKAHQCLNSGKGNEQKSWEKFLKDWKDIECHRRFFTQHDDIYVDGGAIDNTPTNSVVDAVRETIDRINGSKREATLQMFIIFLDPAPRVEQSNVDCPDTVEVVQRTRKILKAAKLSSDAMTVKTINRFGNEGEYLGRALLGLIDSMDAAVFKDVKAVEEKLHDALQNKDGMNFTGKDAEGILERLKEWGQRKIARALPINVDEISIYPENMPLCTLHFSERLGYDKEKATKMISLGCSDTLWAMRKYFEENKEDNDAYDTEILEMTKKWMDIDVWPEQIKWKNHKYQEDLEELNQSWKCKRTKCLYHPVYCPHGKGEN